MADKAESSKQKEDDGLKAILMKLERRYGLLRAAKFGIAGAVGFLVTEVILAIGVLFFYGKVNLPSNDFSSPTLIALNVIAFGLGVTVNFFVNEAITVRNLGHQARKGARNKFIRLLKFQLVYLLGNVVTVLVQLGLLFAFSLSPVYGNIVGAIVAYPVSYFISMRFVWNLGYLSSTPSSASGEVRNR